MSMQAMLQDRISAAQGLLQRVEALRGHRQQVEGRAKLCSKLKAELHFLRRVEAGKVAIKESHLETTNLTHLKAIVQTAESLQGVVSVLHAFSYLDGGGAKRCLVVDVVANGGHTWVKAIGRKAEALHDIWQGRGQYGVKSVVSQAEDFVEASRQQPFECSKPHVIFAFYNGVSSPMADALTRTGISVRGDIVAVNADKGRAMGEGGEEQDSIDSKDGSDSEEDDDDEEEEEAAAVGVSLTRVDRDTVVEHLSFPELRVEECQRINLDVTTLIAYVSSLSHGRCHLSFREAVLTELAAQERRAPVLPGMDSFMKDKQLFACQSAVQDFRVVLETLGGPGEKRRAEELLSRVRVVPDQSSERTQRLVPSAKVIRRSLVIFGTGDTLGAITMTANSGFVRAAASQGVRYSVFIHQSRALTEGKEWRATPL